MCSNEDIANKLFEACGVICLCNDSEAKCKHDKLKKIVSKMLDAASHYKNFEKSLGTKGVALVLGRTAETNWTKALKKSGPVFDNVMNRLKTKGIPKEARKYADLETKLIDYKVKILLGEARDTYPIDLQLYNALRFANHGQAMMSVDDLMSTTPTEG